MGYRKDSPSVTQKNWSSRKILSKLKERQVEVYVKDELLSNYVFQSVYGAVPFLQYIVKLAPNCENALFGV